MELLLQTGIKSTAGDKQQASGGMYKCIKIFHICKITSKAKMMFLETSPSNIFRRNMEILKIQSYIMFQWIIQWIEYKDIEETKWVIAKTGSMANPQILQMLFQRLGSEHCDFRETSNARWLINLIRSRILKRREEIKGFLIRLRVLLLWNRT